MPSHTKSDRPPTSRDTFVPRLLPFYGFQGVRRLAITVSRLPAIPPIPATQSRPIDMLVEGGSSPPPHVGTAVEEYPQTPLPLWNRMFLHDVKLA